MVGGVSVTSTIAPVLSSQSEVCCGIPGLAEKFGNPSGPAGLASKQLTTASQFNWKKNGNLVTLNVEVMAVVKDCVNWLRFSTTQTLSDAVVMTKLCTTGVAAK